MEIFNDPPCCGHQPECAISICWPCNCFRVRGACAVAFMVDLGLVCDPRRDPHARLARLRAHQRAARSE